MTTKNRRGDTGAAVVGVGTAVGAGADVGAVSAPEAAPGAGVGAGMGTGAGGVNQRREIAVCMDATRCAARALHGAVCASLAVPTRMTTGLNSRRGLSNPPSTNQTKQKTKPPSHGTSELVCGLSHLDMHTGAIEHGIAHPEQQLVVST